MRDLGKIIRLSLLALVAVIALGFGACAGYSKYRTWSATLEGEAEYNRAEQNRRIRVLEATAKRDSAKMEAESEIERAKGVAEANRIIADGLKGHDEYLRYLWIEKVAENTGREIIYVPTEASLPILESTRHNAVAAPAAEK